MHILRKNLCMSGSRLMSILDLCETNTEAVISANVPTRLVAMPVWASAINGFISDSTVRAPSSACITNKTVAITARWERLSEMPNLDTHAINISNIMNPDDAAERRCMYSIQGSNSIGGISFP